MIWWMTAGSELPPKHGPPRAANATVAPHANTSDAGAAPRPSSCSGAMNAGVPTMPPVAVRRVPSRDRAMPKSMTRGPNVDSSTLAGFRSRCTTPASWMAVSAVAMPTATASRSAPRSGPSFATAASRLGPFTNSVTRYGGSAAGSASRTGAVQNGRTRCAAATSASNRARYRPSAANSRLMTLMATLRPVASVPAYTVPIPPSPSRSTTR